jgi:hypothetical protein
MERLATFGVRPATGMEPTVKPEGPPEVEAEFFGEAIDMLCRLLPVVEEDLLPSLDRLPGRWHPSGFMVFPLGEHDHLGDLRLHVWLAGLRRLEPRPSGLIRDIHDHVMHIASLVLRGVYSDSLFDVVECAIGERHSAGANLGAGPYSIFMPPPGVPAARRLQREPGAVLATDVAHRAFDAGESHTITVGQFHVPTVGIQTLTATLVFSSPRVVSEGPRILVGHGDDLILGDALPVSRSDAAIAMEQLGVG